jgi:alcohol dehydrogenase YqhD (iron-dependent ADH family)
MIGHELTAMYGIDPRTLAVIAQVYTKLCLKLKKQNWHNTENASST